MAKPTEQIKVYAFYARGGQETEFTTRSKTVAFEHAKINNLTVVCRIYEFREARIVRRARV